LATGSISAYQFNLSGSATTGSNIFGNINVLVSTGSSYGLVINASGSQTSYAISASNGIIIGTVYSSSTTNAVGYFGTASYAVSASNAVSASYAISSSYTINAVTASYLIPTNSYTITNLNVNGNISASSITASNYTGTVYSSSTTNAVGYFGTSSFGNNANSSSYALTASYSVASANAFLQGGNSFAQSASFGTNDNNILVVKTNNITRLAIDANSYLTSSVNIIPSVDNTYNLGSSAFRFTGIYAAQSTIGALFETGLTTVGISSFATGTVLTWRNGKLIPCDADFDEMVMGVVQNGKDEPIVFGAEPVLVTGKVNEGDYIVTSDKLGHGKGIPRGSIHPIDLFAKVIAQAIEGGDGDSYTIKAMIRKM
jgi:hypothetical protein